MNIFALSGFINGALFLLFGGFVFLKNRRSRINQFYILMCLGLAMWMIPYGFWMMAKSKEEATFFLRLLLVGGPFAAFFMSCVFLEILGLTEKKKKILSILFILVLIASFSPLVPSLSPYFFPKVKELPFQPYWPVAGVGFYFYTIICLLPPVYFLYFSIKRLKDFKGIERERINYLLLSLVILFIGFASSNLFNWFGLSLPPYGNFFTFLYALIIAFAILRFHLFEIKVILTELLVGVIGVISLIQAFLAETLRTRILGFSVFFLFCIIGYLLIKYIHREIKAKEILEDKVKERTKELETAKNIAEERAEEIGKRKEDLEKFYKLTVGRELRMVELKKQIKELEEKIKGEGE